ncbi:ABC transporter ATP-binding protein [Desulforamulus ruminis]|uniref:Oligopeptide/dipeptide ABC transporter, ATPase subunit n=1 Tax=Desulforamulus ruminis (strain ATCC 23193 / DSM 2154 / NCIMB 8452 / DL) TaxID=696281 RepID=F6DKW5_DESRL|nr:ABC transporter ATP-binding protein [Desulforamulus ruminis]AEG61597.1 oligopeptide/dipeptide ABC transporter, ATPase subunit [Desulforamulus ruminis DSM 2154]
MTTLLAIKNLTVDLPAGERMARILRGVSLEVKAGEILGLVGESGSGKSITALSVLRLLPGGKKTAMEGDIFFKGQNLICKTPQEMRSIRGKHISMIFQEPMTSLNPAFTIGKQIMDVLLAHQKITKKEAREKALKMLSRVQITDPERTFSSYPHQLSGGMRQRVMIAGALCCEPSLLIADEPTTALDVTIQAQILRLMKEAALEMGTSVLLITHDLGVVAQTCSRVAVMYAGEIVEMGEVSQILLSPRHPYTRALLPTVPKLTAGDQQKLESIPGTVPDAFAQIQGCRFHPRCALSKEKCFKQKPIPVNLGSNRQVTCWLEAPSEE